MWAIDDILLEAGLGNAALALLLALVLGFRHATDPDHLTAVATLVFAEDERMVRRAGWLGLVWGLGHAVTLIALGLPVLLFHAQIPELAHRIAEVAVGVLIVYLALRLLQRWRNGTLHTHPHRHGERWHAHPHVHDEAVARHDEHADAHQHAHEERLGRTPLGAFAIGLVHGVGGSAMVGVVLVAAFPSVEMAVAGLVLLALGTALAMGLISGLLGRLLGRSRGSRWLEAVVPIMAVGSLAFGFWYVAAAAGV